MIPLVVHLVAFYRSVIYGIERCMKLNPTIDFTQKFRKHRANTTITSAFQFALPK